MPQSVIINYIVFNKCSTKNSLPKVKIPLHVEVATSSISECCSFYLSIKLHLLFGNLGCITSRIKKKNTFVCNRVHCYKRVSLSFALQKKGNKNIKPYSLNCIERRTKFLYPFHSHSLQTLFCSLRNTACYSFCTISSDLYRSGNEANVSYIEQYQLVYHANIC